MASKNSVQIGRDAVGNVIVSGKENRLDSTIKVRPNKTTVEPPETVDLIKELSGIRAVLESLAIEDSPKIGRALDDAADEARKAKPNRDEIGGALERALKYAQQGNNFAEQVDKLAPHVKSAVAWLGSNWHQLLSIVGLAV